MSELDELYQEVILDHNRNPRNFGRLEDAQESEGFNPLCGDRISVFVKVEDDRVVDVRFEGRGCAISQASASVMTTMTKGKTVEEVQKLFNLFQQVVTDSEGGEEAMEEIGELAALAGVREFPTRVKCATLAWHTLGSILEGQAGTAVSTE